MQGGGWGASLGNSRSHAWLGDCPPHAQPLPTHSPIPGGLSALVNTLTAGFFFPFLSLACLVL